MKYTVILSAENGGYRATVPALPACSVAAQDRQTALDKVRQAIADFLSHSEIVQIEVTPKKKSNGLRKATPWESYGIFKDDPTLGELFDDIDRRRRQR